ncbi:IS5/IS1182 family transposase, partial [Enterococcus avium]
FAAMNLKKLATWLWKGKEPLFFCSKFRKKSDKKTSQTQITSSRRLLSTVWKRRFCRFFYNASS